MFYIECSLLQTKINCTYGIAKVFADVWLIPERGIESFIKSTVQFL